ncbi:hypothetical protein [Helicobacter pylori]|nr:hypothetical protein [Helicobacter pylori]
MPNKDKFIDKKSLMERKNFAMRIWRDLFAFLGLKVIVSVKR